MALQESIDNYKKLKEAYDQDGAEYTNLLQVRVPQEERNRNSIEQQIVAEERNLRQADSADAIKEARGILTETKEKFQDLVQLVDNLNDKVKAWERTRSDRQREVEEARKDMWHLRYTDLVEQLVFPPEMVTLLEQIIAARDGTDPGWTSRIFGDVVNQKLPSMTNEAVKECKEELATAMGLDPNRH